VQHRMIQYNKFETKGKIIFRFPEDAQIIDYRLKMLEHNHIPGILKIKKIVLNGRIELHIFYEGLEPVNIILEQMGTVADLLRLLEAIEDIIQEAGELLLPADGFILDIDLMFYDLKQKQIYLVYIPLLEHHERIDSKKGMILQIMNYLKKNIEIKGSSLFRELEEYWHNEFDKDNDIDLRVAAKKFSFIIKNTEKLPVPIIINNNNYRLFTVESNPPKTQTKKPLIKIAGFENMINDVFENWKEIVTFFCIQALIVLLLKKTVQERYLKDLGIYLFVALLISDILIIKALAWYKKNKMSEQ